MHRLKFVVFKGTAGFGDRLQCLLQAIAYSKATNRHLVVDWRDSEWAHSPDEWFDEYFDLVDVPRFPLYAFLKVWAAESARWKTWPPTWARHMEHTGFRDWCYKEIFKGESDHGTKFHKIANFEEADVDDDVVVYAGSGFRGFRYSDFQSLRPKAWLSRAIRDYLRLHGLRTGHYDLVHLRAGSKSWAGGKVDLKSLKETIDGKYPDVDSYLNAIWELYRGQIPPDASGRALAIVSDSAWLAEEWIKRFHCGTFLEHTMDKAMFGSGIHQVAADDAASLGVSRFEVNVECLRDFAVMLNAHRVVSDGISLFSKMAAACASSAHHSWLCRG